MTLQYGRYKIVKELGRGTMGVVYQAHDPQIDRLVALKVLRPDRVTSDAFVSRFLKEARAIGRLSHPNIVTVFDAGEDQGTIYIAMEYLKGEPFNEVIRSGRLSVEQSVDIARQIAATLDYAHRQGIVHRDIKPSNIILDADNRVKLTDFGIARIEDAGAGQQTQAGEILGTPVYMSPEQVMGQNIDGRSDLFSLGVILYEMIVGRRPFGGENIAAIFRAITQDQPEEPAHADPFLPKGLSDLVLKCLAKNPDERFQTGAQMATELAAAMPSEQTRPKTTGPPASRSKTRLGAALAITVVLLAVVGGYYFMTQRTGNRAAAMAPGQSDGEAAQTLELGTLKINSDPAGAFVFVDNGLQGSTPLDLELAAGRYELRLSLPGYLEWQAQINLDSDEITPVTVTLWPAE